jgi:periplasmic copper chaperone A
MQNRTFPTVPASLYVAALVLTMPHAGVSCAAATQAAQATQAQAVQIKAAWIRWLPGGMPLAGYATLANTSDQPVVLKSVTSDAFGDLSLHQTQQTGGTVRMLPLERIPIAPRATLDFEAHGIHLMLMQPRKGLDPHGQALITLHFADGSSLGVQFQVRTTSGP